jgi:hypothetical protein
MAGLRAADLWSFLWILGVINQISVARLLVEVDTIGIERVALLFRLVAGLGVVVLVGAPQRRFPSGDRRRGVLCR